MRLRAGAILSAMALLVVGLGLQPASAAESTAVPTSVIDCYGGVLYPFEAGVGSVTAVTPAGMIEVCVTGVNGTPQPSVTPIVGGGFALVVSATNMPANGELTVSYNIIEYNTGETFRGSESVFIPGTGDVSFCLIGVGFSSPPVDNCLVRVGRP